MDNERIGKCALCDAENVELRESHSIPKFVYQWLKESSATPYIRSSDDVNVRHQDGPKEYLLCGCCEGKLSIIEKELAGELFRKVANYRQQSSKIVITETMRVAVISIFWRALLTVKGRDNNRTNSDDLKLQAFLDSAKSQIQAGQCRVEIYFTPFFGDPPYYGLSLDTTYQLERSIGGQDIRFFDDPHRFFATFKLPFMYFHIFSEGWPEDEVRKSTVFAAGELILENIREIPNILRDYIQYMQGEFERTKKLMNERNLEQITSDVGKNKKITGSDKSMARTTGMPMKSPSRQEPPE